MSRAIWISGASLMTMSLFVQTSPAHAAPRCESLFKVESLKTGSSHVDDWDKPQRRSWYSRANGITTFDLATFKAQIEKGLPEASRSDVEFAIVANGIESSERYPYSTREIHVPEKAHGQLDFYVLLKDRRSQKTIAISDLAIVREIHDGQVVKGTSFRPSLAPERRLGAQLSGDLTRAGVTTGLTSKVIEIALQKVVYVLRPNARAEVRVLIEGARDGVDVELQLNAQGQAQSVVITDRATQKRLVADPDNFYLKVDAAFNGNSFFWDDMLVSLATVAHNPWLVRSTIEFWLDVQKMNGGVIPREVRKENLRSLWFDHVIRAGQEATPNLQYTNPYLMHWAVETLYAADPSATNLQLVKRVVESMDQYTQWMEQNRAVRDGQGRFVGFVTNALGSGLDNNRGGRGNDHSAESYGSAWVDPLAQQISMYKSMARWLKLFASRENSSVDAARADRAEARVRELETLLNDRYWNAASGFYYDLVPDGRGGLKQDTRYDSVAGFWPLFSQSASPAQVATIIERHMTADRFGGSFPFPANSPRTLHEKRELLDHEDGYWDRDARWPSMATVAMKGFADSGRPDVAFVTASRFVARMIEAAPDTVAEVYGALGKLTGSPKGRVGQHEGHITRLDFAGWGEVPVVYGMLEFIVGLRPQLDGKLRWNLVAPMAIGESIEVNNYLYRGQLIKKIAIQRTGVSSFEITHDAGHSLPIEVVSYRDASQRLTSQAQPVTVRQP